MYLHNQQDWFTWLRRLATLGSAELKPQFESEGWQDPVEPGGTETPIRRPSSRRPLSYCGRSGIQQVGWCLPRLERATCEAQFTDLNVKSHLKSYRNIHKSVWPIIWTLCGPVKAFVQGVRQRRMGPKLAFLQPLCLPLPGVHSREDFTDLPPYHPSFWWAHRKVWEKVSNISCVCSSQGYIFPSWPTLGLRQLRKKNQLNSPHCPFRWPFLPLMLCHSDLCWCAIRPWGHCLTSDSRLFGCHDFS